MKDTFLIHMEVFVSNSKSFYFSLEGSFAVSFLFGLWMVGSLRSGKERKQEVRPPIASCELFELFSLLQCSQEAVVSNQIKVLHEEGGGGGSQTISAAS